MKPFEQQNYYELLEVPVSATPEEIRDAYARALELYSPDSVAVYALADSEQIEALRQRLTEAVEFLTDASLRAEYDRSIGLAPAANTVVPPVPALVEKAPEASTPPVSEAPGVAEPPREAVAAQPAKAATETVETPAAPREEPVPNPVAAQAAAAPTPPQEAAPAPVAPQAAPSPEPRVSSEPAPAVPVPVPFERLSFSYSSRPSAFSSATFFTSFALPVQPVPPPVAEEAPSKAEPAEPPRPTALAETPPAAAEPLRAPEPVAEPPRAAEPPPEVPTAVNAAAPSVPPAAPAPVERPAQEPEAVPVAPAPEPPVTQAPPAAPVPAADLPEVASDEVTPVRLGTHRRPTPRAAESSRPTPRASGTTPPPLPPRGVRSVRAASQPAAVATPPAEPSRSEPVAPAAESPRSPEPAPGRPSPAQPPEAGLAVAPRPREQPRARAVEIPQDAEFNGELLRRVRESRGYSLPQLAERTRISLRHLENVEADRYDGLPAQVYLRGILMNMARELGLDPLRVSRSYLLLASKQGKS